MTRPNNRCPQLLVQLLDGSACAYIYMGAVAAASPGMMDDPRSAKSQTNHAQNCGKCMHVFKEKLLAFCIG